jgi:hypothetical protein
MKEIVIKSQNHLFIHRIQKQEMTLKASSKSLYACVNDSRQLMVFHFKGLIITTNVL